MLDGVLMKLEAKLFNLVGTKAKLRKKSNVCGMQKVPTTPNRMVWRVIEAAAPLSVEVAG